MSILPLALVRVERRYFPSTPCPECLDGDVPRARNNDQRPCVLDLRCGRHRRLRHVVFRCRLGIADSTSLNLALSQSVAIPIPARGRGRNIGHDRAALFSVAGTQKPVNRNDSERRLECFVTWMTTIEGSRQASSRFAPINRSRGMDGSFSTLAQAPESYTRV